MKTRRFINPLLIFCAVVSPALAGDAPHLPPASDFRLTLVESPQSTVPLGPGCTGEAALTLTCRAFTMTLEYAGENPVRLVWSCKGPNITFDKKIPNSGSNSPWWRVSWLSGEGCAPGTITNLRLKPGERTQFTVRLKGSSQFAEEFSPGPHTLRAEWTLWGCTDNNDADDCFTPIEAMDASSGPYTPSRFQEPVGVVSNEVTANAPQMPDLGSPKFSFEVTLSPPNKNLSSRIPGCDGEARGSIDCVFFHYKLHNVGDRPVRDSRLDCSDVSMTVEYRVAGGEWKSLPRSNRSWDCSLNIPFEMPILSGQTGERDFLLSTLTPGYDTTALQAAGEYGLRFTFWPRACIASPDASFCLTHPQQEASVISPEVVVRVMAGSSAGQSASPHD